MSKFLLIVAAVVVLYIIFKFIKSTIRFAFYVAIIALAIYIWKTYMAA